MGTSQPFGRTGHISSRIIFGSYALNKSTQKEADQVLELLLEYRVNHIDTAPMYGDAEKRIGSWMKKYRQNFFIATKTRRRSYEGAWKDLRNSMQHLNVESIDLWQMHGLTDQAKWKKTMGPGGALQAFMEARDQGLVRSFGVTGHGNDIPGMHLQSLQHFDFEAVMLPYNFAQMQDPGYAKDFEKLFRLCQERKVALQPIKAIARQPKSDSAGNYNTFFYDPLETREAIKTSIHWAMGLPESFVITAGDMQLVRPILEAAEVFNQQPSDQEMKALVKAYGIQQVFK